MGEDEKKLKVIGCMYSCGFPNTIQHVQRDLQLNDARAVTCVMEKGEKDEGDGVRHENWMFYQLTQEGLDFLSNSDPDDEYRERDNNANALFRTVQVTIACPLLEQTDSQV